MPVRYYDTENNNFPKIMMAIGNSVLYYLATKIYPDENPDDLINPESDKHKFILANFDANEETAIYRGIEDLKTVSTSSGKFPFTAYTFSEEELKVDTKSHLQVSGKIFDSASQSYIQAIPSVWDIPCVTFTNNVQDYHRVRQLLSVDSSKLTRLVVPITINSVLTSFTIDINFELTKGNYSYQYEEYLSKGRIYDLMHPLKIKFMYFILNDSVDVALVDSITVSLRTLATEINSSELIQTYNSPETPTISSTVPVTSSTNVDKTQNIIINFSQSMNEAITNSYIDIEPMFPCNFIWNTSSTQLTLQPQSGQLDASTSYTITIEKSVQTINQATLEDNYILTFATGV